MYARDGQGVMGLEPYEAGIISEAPTFTRRPSIGAFVAILGSMRHNRGLQLIFPKTRCCRHADIHEVLVTDQADAMPGDRIDRVAGVGFVEFDVGGVVAQGDRLIVGERRVGVVLGFDETHAPNHINIVVAAELLISGLELDLCVGDEARFVFEPVEGGD